MRGLDLHNPIDARFRTTGRESSRGSRDDGVDSVGGNRARRRVAAFRDVAERQQLVVDVGRESGAATALIHKERFELAAQALIVVPGPREKIGDSGKPLQQRDGLNSLTFDRLAVASPHAKASDTNKQTRIARDACIK